MLKMCTSAAGSFGEADVAVEAGGPLVALSDQEVHSGGTLLTKARNQRRDQPPSHPEPLHPRQQIDVQVRREPLGHLPGGAEMMVDVVKRTSLLRR